MPTTASTSIAQREQRFRAKLKAGLEQFGYRDGIGLLQWELQNREIVGKFADRDGSKAFEFTVNTNGFSYKPLSRVNHDAYTRGVTLAFSRAVSIASSGYAQGLRHDAKKHCTSPTAYSCGDACITRSKQCHIRSIKARQAATGLVAEAQTIQRQQSAQSVSPQQLRRIVESEGDKICTLNYERAVIVDSRTGKVIVNKSGGRDRVDLSPQEVAAMRGNVITHNHPNRWNAPRSSPLYKGVGFSSADIQAACIGQAAEIQAVSTGYRHSMKPPRQGWNSRFYDRQIAPAYRRNSKQVYSELSAQVWQNKMSVDQAEVEFHHRVWERTARDTGMVYRRQEIGRSSQRRAA